ncbi:protease B nonderepressible form [Arachnomyces sp. PD_36]|nr:protease B nonderepressible form [Arachnomyces sp. PD_36]
MKQRITFVNNPDGDPLDPTQIPFKDGVLSIRSWNAAKQDRASFDFTELPQEIWQVLKQCEELHIRWATERPYDALAPFSSRVSPGLHIFHTPAVEGKASDQLCPLLRKAFDDGLSCSPPEDTFITSSEPSTSNPPLQFYQTLESPQNLVTYIQQKICPESHPGCREHAISLLSADSIDIDYDSSSRSLAISGYWSKASGEDGWMEDIRKDGTGFEKVEVGLLAAERAIDPSELSVGGFLAVVGESEKLKPTLFSFPSRHHPLPRPSKYTTSFPPPTGLHPTMKLSFPPSSLQPPTPPPDYTCALHTHLTLPSSLFADKYQLSTTDPLFLNSHNLLSLRSIAGETDLEAPDWVVPRWGSSLLLELATPEPSPDALDQQWDVTIPLHLRYLHPSPQGTRPISIPWPTVFWACTTDDEVEPNPNPFDRRHLGYDPQFGPRTLFYHFNPDATTPSQDLVEEIHVPVLKIEDGQEGILQARRIELGTVLVVVLGFVWVLWKLGVVLGREGVGRGTTGTTREERGGGGERKKDR